jgi:hypothetical protein
MKQEHNITYKEEYNERDIKMKILKCIENKACQRDRGLVTQHITKE